MDYQELLQLSHDHINGYIKLADQKASILLSGQLAFLALSSSLITDTWTKLNNTSQCIALLGGISVAVAIIFSILTIFPREEASNSRGYIFWKDILLHDSVNHFVDQAGKLNEDDVIKSLGGEVYQVSKIADKKYKYLKISVAFTGVFVVLSLFLVSILL